MKLEKTVEAQLGAIVADEGLELLATEIVGSGPKTILRLIVDGPDGVNHDACASISRQASAMLDVEEPVSHGYTLEVSSPGLDRKLYSEDDYQKFIGKRVNIRMQPSFRDHRTVLGEILGTGNGMVRIFNDSGQEIELPLGEIFEARLEVDWNSIMKEGKPRS